MAREANPDQALVHEFIGASSGPRLIDTNPVARDLQATLHAWDAQARTLTLEFVAQARHLQGNVVVHGGVVGTMLDFGLALAVLALLEAPRVAVTAALNVHFERAVMPGALRVQARVDRLGHRLAFASAELFSVDSPSDVLARATATLPVVG